MLSAAYSFLIVNRDETIHELIESRDDFRYMAKWREGFTERLQGLIYVAHKPKPAEDVVQRQSTWRLYEDMRRMDYVDKSGEDMHNPSRGGKSRKRFYKG